jgi:integrase
MGNHENHNNYRNGTPDREGTDQHDTDSVQAPSRNGRRPAPRSRASNGASSIYREAAGVWHGRVSMGVRDDGRPDRRHVQAKTRAEVTRKVKALEKERDSGQVRKAGQTWTVTAWLMHWLENIAAPAVRYKPRVGYRTDVTVHLIPGLGAHRLPKLTPEHVEKLYANMLAKGSSPGTVNHVHRTLRVALSEAVRRGHAVVNAAKIAKAPRMVEEEIEPFTLEEAKRLLLAAGHRRNGVRWVIALALGLRQGEALGLQWQVIVLDATPPTLRVCRSLQRRTWQHGCGGTCGRKRGCDCPKRHGGGLVLDEVKSRAGRRTIALPGPVADLLRAHRAHQDGERAVAAQLWEEQGFVFAGPTGRPVDPRADNREWKDLLIEADVREGRLHDARHTAATILLVLGINQRAVMGVMGWSSGAMTARYQHLIPEVLSGIADQVEGLLWGNDDNLDKAT